MERFGSLMDAVKKMNISGYCYTQLTDVEQETNGLLTDERMPKVPVEEIAKIIGVDSLGYLATDELRELVGNDDFCSACFTNEYPTSIPKGGSKNRFEQKTFSQEKMRCSHDHKL